MSVYVDKYKGYVADAADIEFIRCDGSVYSCKEATATSITPGGDAMTITGGQGLFPLAYIDSSKTLDLSFTNAAFDMDMFEITGTEAATEGNEYILVTERLEISEKNSALYTHTKHVMVPAETYYIHGLEYVSGTTVAEGKFCVTTADTGETGSKLLFDEADVAEGDEILVTYTFTSANTRAVNMKTNSGTARGEVWFHFPVYSSGADCTESAVQAVVHVHIFRARVTTPATFDTSYKTAATFPITFSAIDPHRADARMYEIIYQELSA